jgi:hypothetical protein
MAHFSRIPLSASPNGLPIALSNTTSPGNLLHTAVTATSSIDEVYVMAANVSGGAAKLTVEWGQSGSYLIKDYSIAANSAVILIANGVILNGGKNVAAYSDTPNAINIVGFVNRLE